MQARSQNIPPETLMFGRLLVALTVLSVIALLIAIGTP